MMSVEMARAFYAEEIRVAANVQSAALLSALMAVPREDFLGPGPWQFATANFGNPGEPVYCETPDANPCHVYHNVAIALDPFRELNNGQPATIAACLDILRLRPGETFVHVGCGTGYYTALGAAMVGSSGRVVALEIDKTLAEQAARNLLRFDRCIVEPVDGATYRPGPYDAMLVNAGFTHPLDHWLDSLNDGGRLLLPITVGDPERKTGTGAMLLIVRNGDEFRAEHSMPIAIFTSPSGRDERLNGEIGRAFSDGRWFRVARVRRDRHTKADTCCIHADGICLST
ncbi:MAG: methyltransferase [Pseudorhodoplanes sp.]|nr:methyltransferase [Pseudorhodoplanes sp.]